jgi:hypothetical protein
MSRKAELQVAPPPLPAEKAEQVRATLEAILGSPVFRASRRCQTLLRHIVEETLAGHVDSLKERSLGVDLFGRAADYDTSQDPVIRATAAEARKKLAQYYLEIGHDPDVRINLPSGAYIAEFQFGSVRKMAPAAVAPSGKRLPLVAAVLCLAALSVLAVEVTPIRPKESALDYLWDPVVKTPGSVLVGVGLQTAYNPRSAQVQDGIQGIVSPPEPRNSPSRGIRAEDLVLVRDRYVALDDALSMVRLTARLESYRKPYHIRGEQSMSFADLRDTPAVLIGAFDNPWSLRAAAPLRFTFRKDSESDTGMVYDRLHPENTSWKLANYWPFWDIPADYAIVTRMRDATADRPVIIAAGLTQYGTFGAAEFLTNSQYFDEAARQLPPEWPKKNLQIVLLVPVVNHIAGRPQILASHVW